MKEVVRGVLTPESLCLRNLKKGGYNNFPLGAVWRVAGPIHFGGYRLLPPHIVRGAYSAGRNCCTPLPRIKVLFEISPLNCNT